MNTQVFRVTSVQKHTKNYCIFSGVPIGQDDLRVNDGKFVVSVVSNPQLLPVEPALGQHWHVSGTYDTDSIDSNGFELKRHTYKKPQQIICSLPESGEQLVRFIAKTKDFHGIGEIKARQLWQAFGRNLVSVATSPPTPDHLKVLNELLSSESLKALYAGFAKYKNLGAANWLTDKKIPAPIQQRILKHHDNRTIDAIKANPYILMAFGMSFNQISELAKKEFAVTIDDPRRLTAAVEQVLKEQVAKGHTYVTRDEILPMLSKIIGGRDLARLALVLGQEQAQYIYNKKDQTFHPSATLLMEAVVAKRILHLASQKDLFDWKAERAYKAALSLINYELTSGQHHAVGASLDNAFNIIAGGAGTGKTTVSFAVTSAYQALQYSIHPIALSGRAAMRLSESIGIETMTIARFLRGDPIDQGQGHLLVIDEASMIDIPTMYRLVVHCHPDTRMLMVGDPNQLPPIGSGKVLSDIIESDVTSVTKLDVVKRQEASSGIPEYSNIINSGEIPHNLTMGAIVFHETSSELITQKCKTIYAESPVNSRVVAPTKAMVSEINGLIQNAINPDSERMYINYQGEPFFLDYREGDQILFTENHYDKDIQNGTLGVLTSTQASPDGFGTVILDTGKSISVTESLLDCIQLGYAITLHKAQGSQFKRVIIALAPGRIVDRAWLYTAITRAEAEVHIVGSEKDLTDITKKLSNANRRKSYLSRMLMSNKNTENTATTSGANRMALNKKWEN